MMLGLKEFISMRSQKLKDSKPNQTDCSADTMAKGNLFEPFTTVYLCAVWIPAFKRFVNGQMKVSGSCSQMKP